MSESLVRKLLGSASTSCTTSILRGSLPWFTFKLHRCRIHRTGLKRNRIIGLKVWAGERREPMSTCRASRWRVRNVTGSRILSHMEVHRFTERQNLQSNDRASALISSGTSSSFQVHVFVFYVYGSSSSSWDICVLHGLTLTCSRDFTRSCMRRSRKCPETPTQTFVLTDRTCRTSDFSSCLRTDFCLVEFG